MIDFDEEIKKFNKSLDIDELNEALTDADVTDMTDLMYQLIKKNGG